MDGAVVSGIVLRIACASCRSRRGGKPGRGLFLERDEAGVVAVGQKISSGQQRIVAQDPDQRGCSVTVVIWKMGALEHTALFWRHAFLWIS